MGRFAAKRGYTLIENLASHGVGRSLHEYPEEIATWPNRDRRRIEKGLGTMEDLDTIESITKQACGKTICVMAEAFSWPAESYIAKFRDEFVEHIEKGACPFGGKLCEHSL